MQNRPVAEHSPRAPERSLLGGVWSPERMHRTLLAPPGGSCGRLRKVQQARLLPQVRQECELGFIRTQDFAHQHEAQ
jgi:hypothetical protein